jgi:hypothetical protein
VLRTLDSDYITSAGKGMNDPEMNMSSALAHHNLVAHEKAVEAAGDAITLVVRVPAALKSIADQVIRSASSGHDVAAAQSNAVTEHLPRAASRRCR